jgi:excisionase family DNA binding protein
MINREYISAEEVAIMTSLSAKTIIRYAQTGEQFGGIPAYRIGKRYLFKADDIRQWIHRQRIGKLKKVA